MIFVMPRVRLSTLLNLMSCSKNVDDITRLDVKSVFPVGDLTPNSIYLGHPLIFNHNDRTQTYNFILTKFRAKLTTIKGSMLNHAGRLVYINSVLNSIPINYMSTVLFSKTFIAKITAIIRKFWWAGVQEENGTSPFHFRSWDDICKPKYNGGLGITDIYRINQSLLINAAWNIDTNKNPFLTSILKAKYYPNCSFWTASNNICKSIFWSSTMQIKHFLHNNCVLQIHNGESSIWSTPWCALWNSIHDHIKLPVTVQKLPHCISDLWVPHNHSWDIDLISQIFDDQAVNCTANTQIVPSNSPDRLRWMPAKKGLCSSKEAFFLS